MTRFANVSEEKVDGASELRIFVRSWHPETLRV
jgi:hypothetical protein